MKFFFFHLMPYGALDLSWTDHHESAWVTLPNSYYDPKEGYRLYNRYMDELVHADVLGFDGVCVNEHHQTAYGMMPAPNVLAGALARQTKNAKICVLGRALPLIENPIYIAEEFAMLDNLSGGRLITGFVRGIGCEYHASMANPGFSHERFHEAHDLIVAAWTKTGPFEFAGKHFYFQYVNLWPRPYQTPHPPIWVPSQGSTETIDWASHPDHRYTYLQTFSPIDSVSKYMTQYRDTAARYGYQSTPDQLGWALPIYVAETDAIAQREAKEHAENFYAKFIKSPIEYRLPPGYTSMASMKGMIESKFKYSLASPDFDTLQSRGMFVCGSPATVIEKITAYQERLGFGNLITMLQFATLPAELTRKNMNMFASEVMPHLRPVGASPARATAAAE
ncbi:MAG: LLM class flavin-dependent oxidoreductase [Rhodospirillales bacterium]